MPTGATMQASSPATDNVAKNTSTPTVTPFTRASNLKREPGNVDTTKLITASDQDLGTFDLPATGYARSVVILVSPSVSGSGGSAAGQEDAPFSALKNISIAEPNGSTVPFFNSGYELMLANKFGGYRFANDPRQSPVFSAINATTGNFTFLLRIPLELTIREGLGSLPNQDAASTFKLRMQRLLRVVTFTALTLLLHFRRFVFRHGLSLGSNLPPLLAPLLMRQLRRL
jgi:hypothetical protein